MSTPSEPGRSPYPEGAAGQPGGPRPSGPPLRPTGPGPGPQPSGPGRPGPDQPPQGWVPQPRPGEQAPPYAGKSFFGALFDFGFDDMITPTLVRTFYILFVMVSTVFSLVLLLLGIAVFQYGWLLTVAAFVFTPLIWLLTVVLARIFLEAVIVHFKGVEYMRANKDRSEPRP